MRGCVENATLAGFKVNDDGGVGETLGDGPQTGQIFVVGDVTLYENSQIFWLGTSGIQNHPLREVEVEGQISASEGTL